MPEQHVLARAGELETKMWQQYESGRVESALQLASELTTTFQRDDAAWYAVSQLLYKLRKVAPSRTAILNAVKLKPSKRNLLQLANVHVASGDSKSAEATLNSIDFETLGTIYELDTAARICVSLDRHSEAKALYERALKIAPKDADLLYNYATVCRFLGGFYEAANALKTAMSIRPNFTAAMLLDSGLRTKTETDNQLEALETVIANQHLTPKQRVEAGYALFKELEDLGQFDYAGKVLFSAATLRRSHLTYSIENDLRIMRDLMATFSQFPAGESQNVSAPVFIVGLPRSGSTLLERLIGQSEYLQSVGETDYFSRALERTSGRARNKFELLSGITAVDWNAVADNYIGSLPSHVARSIDKLPMNVLNVGAIVRAFPNARILITQRHPLDNLFAMYKTLFEDAYPFSYDLVELAKYYIGYQKLVDHWLGHFPEQVRSVEYEALVTDTETVMSEVAEFLGVPLTDDMLDPTNNKSASTTASATQVRQPIHQRSFGSWRRMEADMQVCKRMLDQAGLITDDV